MSFLTDTTNVMSENTKPIPFDNNEAISFITDQFAHLRHNCRIGEDKIADSSLIELCILRYLAYRHRLMCANYDKAEHYVKYNDAQVEDPTSPYSLLGEARGSDRYPDHRETVMGLLGQNLQGMKDITGSFANIVCVVAYVFRQKGHHYIDTADYSEAYKNMWLKVKKNASVFVSTWANIAIIGLHAIIPCVLDLYWLSQSLKGRISPPLALRSDCAAAGTAAVFALRAGWDDARKVYGDLLYDQENCYKELKKLVDLCTEHRWRHAINARYYGETAERINMSRFSSLSATVIGVYQGAAPEATLLGAKSLQREASNSPLQRDVAKAAAKFMKKHYIKELHTSGKQVPAITEN